MTPPIVLEWEGPTDAAPTTAAVIGPPGPRIIAIGIDEDGIVYAGADGWVDTSSGTVTVLLPEDPGQGAIISLIREGAHALVIDPNGNTIQGVAANYTVGIDGEGVTLRYVFGTWKLEVRPSSKKTGQPVGLLLAITRAF